MAASFKNNLPLLRLHICYAGAWQIDLF